MARRVTLRALAAAAFLLFLRDAAATAAAPAAAEDRESCRGGLGESALLRWAEGRGGLVDGVRLATFAKGADGAQVRGLAARRAFAAGDVIMRMPPDVLLNSSSPRILDAVGGTQLLPSLLRNTRCEGRADRFGGCRIRLVAALLAMREAGRCSANSDACSADGDGDGAWCGYAEHLPSLAEYRGFHPMLAEEKLLDAFGALPVVRKLTWQQHYIAKRWANFSDLGGNASLDEWTWGEVVAQTRSWQDPNSAFGELLYPVFDSMNANVSEHVNVAFRTLGGKRSLSDRFAEAIATKDIMAGQELVLGVGLDALSNGDIARNWGFALPLAQARDEALDERACEELAQVVGGSLADDCSCEVPGKWRSQAATFCTFARLAAEQCVEAAMGISGFARCASLTKRKRNQAASLAPNGALHGQNRTASAVAAAAASPPLAPAQAQAFFRNALAEPVRLFWLPRGSEAVDLGDIAPGALRPIQTSVGHVFAAVRQRDVADARKKPKAAEHAASEGFGFRATHEFHVFRIEQRKAAQRAR